MNSVKVLGEKVGYSTMSDKIFLKELQDRICFLEDNITDLNLYTVYLTATVITHSVFWLYDKGDIDMWQLSVILTNFSKLVNC